MTGRPLHILFTPSIREGLWAEVIRETAEAKGLSVAYWGEGEADVLIAHNLSIEMVVQVEPREWVIMADTPAASLISYGDAYKEYPPAGQALAAASHRFASAAWLAERGAPVLGQPAMAVSLPKLGLVSQRQFDMPANEAGPLEPALAIYQGLPIRVGAKSVLPPVCFAFPANRQADGGPSRIDLTGRDRLLMDGPYMLLPPGLWRATLKMAIDPHGHEAPLAFDWGEAHDMVTVEETVTEPGYYSVSLDRIFETAGTAVLRISLTQPLFQGMLEVQECVIERLGDPAPKLPLKV